MANLMSQGVLSVLKMVRGVLLMIRRLAVLFLRSGSLDENLNGSGVCRVLDGDEAGVHADLH